MKYLVWLLLLSSVSQAGDLIKVMVMDAGVDRTHKLLNEPWRVIAFGADAIDEGAAFNGESHGTHVTGLVLYGNTIIYPHKDLLCPEVVIYHCKVFSKAYDTVAASNKCLGKADLIDINYINYSGGGSEADETERSLIKRLLDKGVTIVVAAGNNGSDLHKKPYYPASYKDEGLKVITVGNGKDRKHRHPTSNWDKNIPWRDGDSVVSTGVDGSYVTLTGTSQSAPIYLHDLLKKRCNKIDLAKQAKK
jgi:subtilisin family serine protease